MHKPWTGYVEKRKLINKALSELDDLAKEPNTNPKGFAKRVDELKARINVLTIALTGRESKFIDQCLEVYTLNRAAETFEGNVTLFTEARQATALGLTGYDNPKYANPKYANKPARDNIFAGKILTDSLIN